MKLIVRFLEVSRRMTLTRQLHQIRRIVGELGAERRREAAQLVLSEIQAASKVRVPHLYASKAIHTYLPWGDATDEAVERARSPLTPVRLRGIALWLAVAYHETREANDSGLQAVHRDVLGLLADLKGSRGQQPSAGSEARAAA